MGPLTKCVAVALSVGIAGAGAGPAPAPQPTMTPAAILPRDNTQTLGWYSDGQTAGETIYAPWVFDAETTTYTSSGSYFRRCAVSTSCIMYTSCSNGYMMAAGTSSYCGISGATGGASTNYCSNHVLLPTLDAKTGGQSWYWCDEAPLTGHTFYAKEPPQPTLTPASSNSQGSDASTTISDESTSPTSGSSTATSSGLPLATILPSNNGNSSTSVGAIAGGVVGGVFVLGAIAFAILWTMRRDRKKKEAVAAYQPAPLVGSHMSYQQNPGYPPQTDYYAASAYQVNEQKPQDFVQQSQYPQAYPLGLYDPHVSQQYAGSPPPQELGVPTELTPQELPAQQRPPR
ncbi:Nn.00g015330.m01.CDS01 [Neocucurbitaria sp. VM-36]